MRPAWTQARVGFADRGGRPWRGHDPLTAAVTGRGPFYYATMAGVIAVVCLSANTSFADFPRLCRLLALDNHLPYAFASRSRRLVNASGILVLAGLSGVLLVAFGGVTDRLVPLFAIGAFGAFTLSQAGMVAHWRSLAREPAAQTGHRVASTINAVGAVATGAVLVVVLVTKFIDGAWVVVLLIPTLYLVFVRVHTHYAFVRQQTDCATPLSVTDLRPPVMAVVMRRWSTITRNALRFALSMSDDVVAVHINSDAEEGRHLAAKWHAFVEARLQAENRPAPNLIFVESPYRLFLEPLFEALTRLADENPGRTVALVAPELIGGRWSDYLLHNQRTTALKKALLLRGDQRLVLVNVPWQLARRRAS